MARTDNLSNYLTDIATAIRNKKKTTGKIKASNFDTEISSIITGVDTSDATAVASNILSGKTAYAKGSKITGTMVNRGSKTITPSSSSQTFSSGYYSGIQVNAQTGTAVKGTTKSYVASGTINSGNFVKLVSSKVQKVTSSSDTILGIAKTSVTSGQTAQVIVPN